jgi:hypothetical protein
MKMRLLLGQILSSIALLPVAHASVTTVAANLPVSIPLAGYSSVSGMCNDNNGAAFDLGCVTAAASVAYPLNITQAGTYLLTVNYSSPTGSTGVNLLVNGVNAGSIAFSATGSWSSYSNASPIAIVLPAGVATLTLQASQPGFNLGGVTLAPSSLSVAPSGITTIALRSYSSIAGMCNDSNGVAFDLGCVTTGGYVIYPISVAAAGSYAVTLNYASPTGSTGANLLVNGVKQASVALPSTGGSWSTYSNAAPAIISLPAGIVTLEIQAQGPGFNLDGLALAPMQPSVAAVGTSIIPLQMYSSMSGMCNDANGLSFDLGCVAWQGYVVYPMQVQQAGNYAITLNYSSPGGNTGVNVLVNGVKLGSVSFAATDDSWQDYVNAVPIVVQLPAGLVNLELQAQQPGFNLGGVSLSPALNSIAASVPTTISLANSAVTGMCADANGLPYDLGCIVPGGSAAYALNVAQAGTYALTLNYASPAGNAEALVLLNGAQVGALQFPSTGSWSTYLYASPLQISLPAGPVTLEIEAPNGGFNLGGLSLSPSSIGLSSGAFGSVSNPVVASFAPPSNTQLSSSYFGMTIQNLAGSNPSTPTPFPSFPLQTLRLWDVSYWSQLEPSSGQYNWTNLDNTIAVASHNGVNDYIFTLGHVPAWASSNPYDATCSEGYGTCDAPDINAFDSFLTTFVQRYCGVVKYYETWNEPDESGFWNGTNAQLLTIASHAYQITKDPANCGCQNGVCSPGGGANPNQVLLPPIGGLGEPSQIWLGGYLAAAGGNYPYADIAAFHGYGYGTPEGILQGVNLFEQTITPYGLGSLPVWNTEADWGPRAGSTAQTDEASWLMRYYTTQAATGVSRFIWYSYDNCAWGTLWGPACTSNDTPFDSQVGVRSAGVAYGVLENWLIGRTLDHCDQYQNGLWACQLDGPNNYTGWIVWSATSTSLAVASQTQSLTDYHDWQNNVYPWSGSIMVSTLPILLEN